MSVDLHWILLHFVNDDDLCNAEASARGLDAKEKSEITHRIVVNDGDLHSSYSRMTNDLERALSIPSSGRIDRSRVCRRCRSYEAVVGSLPGGESGVNERGEAEEPE